MPDNEVDDKFVKLEAALPTHLKLLGATLCQSHKKLRDALNSLTDAMSHLRILVKYQTFDLEATRRENEELKKQIAEMRNGEGSL